MPRKGPAPRRELMPDPIYRSVLVTQLVNKVLLRGKRSLAERSSTTPSRSIEGQDRRRADRHPQAGASRTSSPQLEVKSRRVGGATYQVPVEVRPRRATTLAIRWLVGYSRQRREKTMAERLANELLDASQRHRRRPSSAGKTCTRWPSRTRPSPTTAGKRASPAASGPPRPAIVHAR